MSRASPRFKRINPPLPPVGTTNGVVEYVLAGSLENQLTISTFMYAAAVPAPTPTQVSTLLTNISTALFTLYKTCLSLDWTCQFEKLAVVHRNDLAGATTTANLNTPGLRTTGHLPTEVAAVILRQTAVKGQHGRGRLSLPAISVADVTNSRITAAALTTALTNLANGMKSTVSDGTNTWTPCIGQRSGTTPRLIVGFSTITATSFGSLLGTIRRRKIGRGK